MYTQFFNLREMPFSIAPDPAYLYMSPRHQEALGHLLYGTGKYGGFVQLTGEVGTGKTTIIRTLLAQRLDNVDVAMIHNPRQSEREFVQSICDELGISYDKANPSLKALVDALNAYLIERHTAGRRTVLIIDEAQQLAPDVLEQVRLLTNLETDKEKLLRIMLIGQPELAELLARQDLRQLAQRITARYHLTPLSGDETMEYIAHRLQVAGGARDLFSPAAIKLIHKHAGGIPRLVNILCDRALLGAYSQSVRQVTPEMVSQAAAEVFGTPASLIAGIRPPTTAARVKPTFQLPRLTVPGGWLRWAEGVLVLAGLVLAATLLMREWRSAPATTEPASTLSEPASTPSSAESSSTATSPVPDAVEPRSASPEPVAVQSASTPQAAPPSALADAYAPLNSLVQRLAQLWQPGFKLQRGERACNSLRVARLECLKGSAEWNDLVAMNSPAVLTISEGGSLHYVLLRELGNEQATLLGTRGSVRVPVATLDPLWTGEYLLLWRRETDETLIGPDIRGEPILWLRQRLAARLGAANVITGDATWDEALRKNVQRLQSQIGARPDGIAGPRTLIALASQPGPVLSARKKATP
ncbi:MAG: AAA family ATPase [Stagnimonas sp.]|nr:AAA family ATPase [Stagnimonas sp.]